MTIFIADLVNRLPFGPELAEWVVAAVEPSVTLRELERRGKILLVHRPGQNVTSGIVDHS